MATLNDFFLQPLTKPENAETNLTNLNESLSPLKKMIIVSRLMYEKRFFI